MQKVILTVEITRNVWNSYTAYCPELDVKGEGSNEARALAVLKQLIRLYHPGLAEVILRKLEREIG